MKGIWGKEKRKIAAFLVLALIMNIISYIGMEPVQAADLCLHKIMVNVKNDRGEAYQGATVTVSGNHEMTGKDGNCEFQVENGDYEIIAQVKAEDCECYEEPQPQITTVSGNDVQVSFALVRKTYEVSIAVNGEGGTVSGGNAVVPYGETAVLTAIPNSGYYVKEVTCEGNSVLEAGSLTENTGAWVYEISQVTEDKAFQVTFSQIPIVQGAGELTYVVRKADNILTSEGGIYYSNGPVEIEFTAPVETVFSTKAYGTYGTSIVMESTGEIHEIYARRALGAFTVKRKYDLSSNAIRVCIDKEKPEIVLADKQAELWIDGDCTGIDLQGAVSDDKVVDRIVWSDMRLAEEEVLSVSSGNMVKVAAGNFTIANQPIHGDETHYYLYAVDKADNCSAEAEVTIYRDGTVPVITSASIVTENVKRLDFGNFYNGPILLTVSAQDVGITPASGVKRVNVYAGDTLVTSRTLTEEEAEKGTDLKEFVLQISQSDFVSGAFLRLTVEDSVGLSSAAYELTDLGISSTWIMLETMSPKLSIQLPLQGCYKQEAADGNKYWYREVPDMKYTASEEGGSGLYSMKVYQTVSGNGQAELLEYTKNYGADKAVYMDSADITASSLTGVCEGKNTIYISGTDLAGNMEAVSQDYYIDSTEPQITNFIVEKAGETTLQKMLNKLGFGTFANGMLTVTVSAKDVAGENQNAEEFSGLKDITLYLDNIPYKTKAVDEAGKAVFEIPAQDITDNVRKVYLEKKIYAQAVDNVGNTSPVTQMTTQNSNLRNSNLMIENNMPVITINMAKKDYVAANGVVYVKEKTDYLLEVTDVDSGIGSVRVLCNGTELFAHTYQESVQEKKKSYIVSMTDMAEPTDMLYQLKVVAVDNAGNEKILQADIVCLDEDAPEIMNFVMEAEGSMEADGTTLFYEDADYGYYFRENTRVTVYAKDGEKEKSSGVKSISYYLSNADGVKSKVITAMADADEKISFVIPAGFKGQIYACASDNLDNDSAHYVTPAGLVLEDAQLHTREEHIAINLPGTGMKDMNGLDLYNNKITVDVNVKDTFSGIRRVEWSVTAPQDTGKNQGGSVELDNDGNFVGGNSGGFSKTSSDRNLVTGMTRQFQIDHNSNKITLWVSMTDRAGNTSNRSVEFSIDTMAPVITLSFDNMTADEEFSDTYAADRVASITVRERNFSGSAVVTNVTNVDGSVPRITGWKTAFDASNPDDSISTTTIVFSEDGKYTLEVSGADMAGNAAAKSGVYEFIVDKTLPQISVTYDNETAVNEAYYATERRATIRIEEHNFEPERVQITGTATDNGETVTFPAASSFIADGDVHTATIYFAEDANYSFEVAYRDRAGNQGEPYISETFVVDKTAPEIVIKGVEDMSANNGAVVPVIELSDTNYDKDGVTLELTGAGRGRVTVDGSFSSQANGQIFTFSDFPREQASDDLYTLNVTLRDRAGNESRNCIMFSVNRFGSVYAFDDSLKQIIGTYVQKEQDIKLSEINVDNLEHDTIRVVLDVNGTPRNLMEGEDYSVVEKGGNGSWYQYDYTIKSSLFAGDGRYIVTLYSKDRANNVNENIDETKKAEISFGVDKTPPIVVPIDISSKEQYAADVKVATVTVNDNLVLQNVDIYIGQEKCDYTENGDAYTFHIPGAVSRQDITVAAVDAAGNRTNYVIGGVLVTSNAFVRWYNNTPLFAGSLAGVAVVSGGAAGFAGFRKRRKIRIK